MDTNHRDSARQACIALAALFLLMIAGCANEPGPAYRLLRDIPYDESAAANTAWGEPAQMRCLKIQTIGANGSPVQGSAQLTYHLGGSGIPADYYDCFPSENVSVLLSAPGHTPKRFEISVPAGRMLEIESRLSRSCSEPSLDAEHEGLFAERLGKLGLENHTYRLECMEYRPGRSSILKGTGVTDGGARFAFAFRTGWCSSGGADCGLSTCFSTRDKKLFSEVINTTCPLGCEQFIYRERTLTYALDNYGRQERGAQDCLGAW